MITPEHPLCKVESFIQVTADHFAYTLSCGHVVEITVADTTHPELWMMRCPQCPNTQPDPRQIALFP